MKILFYTDVHWSQYSSILRTRGNKYSKRLENLLQSLNWVEYYAVSNGCEKVVCLGDFFDKPELNAEEITALSEVKFSNLPHYFLIGNHESNVKSLEFSSTNCLKRDNFYTISKQGEAFTCDDTYFYWLPYTTNPSEIPDLKAPQGMRKIILSHNDIKGINYGGIISTKGYDINDISKKCDLFLNGHLHNGGHISPNIFNLGNLTGQDFKEDAFKYKHNIAILDTKTHAIDFVENPYALKFYNINSLDELNKISGLPFNVISIHTSISQLDKIKECIESKDSIIAHRIIIDYDKQEETQEVQTMQLKTINHLDKFKTFILSRLGNDEIIKDEVNHIIEENV